MISFKKTFITLSFLISLQAISQVPYMVKDLNPGSGDVNGFGLYPINNGVLFINNDMVNGHELWFSDGTSDGTYLVKDINQGVQSSYPSNFIFFGNKFLFWANDGINGNELWESDGTSNGTKLLKDLIPGTIGGTPSYTFSTGTKLYFTMNYPGLGGELFVCDGTSSGTFFLKDINPGIGNSNADNFILDAKGNIFFTADNGATGKELWYSDASTAGTFLIKDVNIGTVTSNITMHKTTDSLLFFTANTVSVSSAYKLFRSNGTAGGTFALGSFIVTNSDTCKNKLFFCTNANRVGFSDGTVNGTKTSSAFISQYGAVYSNIYRFDTSVYYFRKKTVGINDSLYLLKITDTLFNVSVIKRMGYPKSAIGQKITIEQTNADKFLFHEFQPAPGAWTSYSPKTLGIIGVSDGSNSGTIVSHLKTPHSFNESSKGLPFLNNQWVSLMSVSGGFSDFEFHNLDANTGIVSLIKDINNGTGSSYFPTDSCYDCGWCYKHVIQGNKLYFVANDGVSGYELFETDGTTAGTKLLLDIYPGNISGLNAGYGDCASEIVSSGGRLFFYANNNINGTELWSMGVNIDIKENDFENDFTVFPNPANSVLNIKSENSLGKSTILVTDILGKIIIETKNNDLYQTSINIEQLSNGVYLLQLKSEKGIIVKKFVKG